MLYFVSIPMYQTFCPLCRFKSRLTSSFKSKFELDSTTINNHLLSHFLNTKNHLHTNISFLKHLFQIKWLKFLLSFRFHTAVIWLSVFLAIQRYIYVCSPSSIHRFCTPKITKVAILLITFVSFWKALTSVTLVLVFNFNWSARISGQIYWTGTDWSAQNMHTSVHFSGFGHCWDWNLLYIKVLVTFGLYSCSSLHLSDGKSS